MPSVATVRGLAASRSIDKLPEAEREVTWALWWRIDDFHIAKTGADVAAIGMFFLWQVVLGMLFGEVTVRGLSVPFWTFCVSMALAIAVDLALRTWYYDAKVAEDIEQLRREIYISPDKQNAFRYLLRTVPDLLPKSVVGACE